MEPTDIVMMSLFDFNEFASTPCHVSLALQEQFALPSSPSQVDTPWTDDVKQKSLPGPIPSTISFLGDTEQQFEPIQASKSIQEQSVSLDISLDAQQQFLIFMKILFEYIRVRDSRMLKQTKTIVATCTLRNRMKDPAYMPLMDSVEKRLRKCIGEGHWECVKLDFLDFCTTRGIFPMLPFASFDS